MIPFSKQQKILEKGIKICNLQFVIMNYFLAGPQEPRLISSACSSRELIKRGSCATAIPASAGSNTSPWKAAAPPNPAVP